MEVLVVMTVFLSAVTNVQRSDAATYTVGDSSGWSTPSNGDSTYTTWANQHQFVAGDVLVFNFNTGLHTVATVNNKNDYDSCNAANANVQTNGPFAGLLVGNAPSKRFTGAKATMTIWNPSLRGEKQYSSASLYVEDGDNQIRVGWISDNYGKTGCYINHCPGFVMTSNVVPLDYAFPNISVLRGEQFDVTLQVVKRSTGDWEFNYNDQQLGTWTSSIFSKMGESASQLRFGGECYEPENQGVSPQMGSGGRFREGKYDRTAYMRQLSYTDPIYGDAVLDDSMVQVQISRCYFATNEGYNFKDDWYGYSFMYGEKPKLTSVRQSFCLVCNFHTLESATCKSWLAMVLSMKPVKVFLKILLLYGNYS
nr:cucumber peeling cupredoxin-like [Ipomoea batatas]